MMQLKHLGLCVAAGFSMNAMAADFSFDRPGSGIGTGITPVGQLAWSRAWPMRTMLNRPRLMVKKTKPPA